MNAFYLWQINFFIQLLHIPMVNFEQIDFWSLIHVPQSINQCTIRPQQSFCLLIWRWQRCGRDSVCDNQVQQRTVLYQVDPEDEGGGLCHHQRRRGVHVYILVIHPCIRKVWAYIVNTWQYMANSVSLFSSTVDSCASCLNVSDCESSLYLT